MPQQVKRAFRYRFHPTGEQAAEPSRTFGCVRLVYNKALEERTAARHMEQRRISYVESSARLTQWKRTDAVGIDAGITSLVTLSTGEKVCGTCGTVRATLPLNVREWTCDCGAVHDRDVNAARNILAAGLAASACGAGVRPQRESSRTGQSATKQEAPRHEP